MSEFRRPLVVYAVDREYGGGWAWRCRRCGDGYWMTSGHADVLAAALWHCANAPEWRRPPVTSTTEGR